MENFGLKGLFVTLYQRVVLSWKTTLTGFVIALAVAAVDYYQAAPLPSWAHALLFSLAGLLALIKEKNRTAPPTGIVGVFALACLLILPSCAATKRVGRATLDCAAPAMLDQAKAFAPTLIDALLKPTTDWSQEVDHLVLSAGAVGLCAMQAIVAEIESKPAPAVSWTASHLVGPPDNDELILTRARKWLAANR